MDEFRENIERIHALNMLRNDYAKTIMLLKALKSGSVTMDQINITADGWQIMEVQIEAEDPQVKTEQ